MAPRTNYVLCCWSGDRRTPDVRRDVDSTFYLRTHLRSLRTLKHHLTQITIMVPANPKEPSEYREFLRSVPAEIQGAKVVIVDRPNVGMSYGSLSDCYARYRTEFDYYFFMEDDYVFTLDDFDKLHVDAMEADPACGYLCGLAWTNGLPLHAGIANGIMRASALERVFAAHHGKIPHADNANYGNNESVGQVGQSQAIIGQGFTLRDWARQYRVVFRDVNTEIRNFHEECRETMMRPV